MKKAEYEWKRETGNDNGVVVPMLPHDHRVFSELAFIVFGSMMRIDEEPDAVAMPKSFLRVVGIFLLIRASMVANMISGPPKRGVLERPPSCDEQEGLHPWMAFEAAVRNEPMIADRNTQAGKHIQNAKQDPIEQCVAIEKADERCADYGYDGYQAKQDERLIGKRRSSNSVRHSYSYANGKWTSQNLDG